MEHFKIFKFGGASVKDAKSIVNVGSIAANYKNQSLVLVISAMGKTTNKLEEVCQSYFFQREDFINLTENLKQYHLTICKELFEDENHEVFKSIETIFSYLNRYFEQQPNANFDLVYDQVVPVGELLSSKILSAYLNEIEIKNTWLDARKLVLTDSKFRKANVDWELTNLAIANLDKSTQIMVTQGFIGGTKGNFMTTLGREGSDYTAAIFANALNADSVTIWKDVPGVLNADPKFFNNTVKLEKISYKEAIELAYYGATVIHPKTIKPLQNKEIPLWVKSFENPAELGTLISSDFSKDHEISSFIFKQNQVLISISPKDFSFIGEENLSEIFKLFADCNLEVNTMQNSAINFSVCVDYQPDNIDKVRKLLAEKFIVKYNENLNLLTIRHYTPKIIAELVKNREILLEQKTRNTVRILMR